MKNAVIIAGIVVMCISELLAIPYAFELYGMYIDHVSRSFRPEKCK